MNLSQRIGERIVIPFGMGLAMAPATEAVMGSLPKDKAGVGSAVSNTTRQIGGALGVAILGSILSSSCSAIEEASPGGRHRRIAVHDLQSFERLGRHHRL